MSRLSDEPMHRKVMSSRACPGIRIRLLRKHAVRIPGQARDDKAFGPSI
jgi:hypothetical protein